ncbi:hypothetical protein BDR22DRAFT_933683 [Usnea florida]
MSVQDPVAIVGMGCRLPGDVDSPSDLWQMLQENRSGQCRVPSARWNVDAFYDSDPEYAGTLHHHGGYFIQKDIRAFDNGFFGINNLEATSMDPQQRNLLEVVYQCLESAGAKLEDVSGQNIGCYVGSFTNDYINISFKDPDSITRYGATGIGTTVLSNRISHIFNLVGPSFVIDTACSSSLYALHNACLALQTGETEAALVCGTNLIMSPEQQIATVKAGVLSQTSTCHSFDNSADGYGRADGVGVLYIKRLRDAIRDRDPIRSIIRGTALNCNGRTFGITLPSIEGQEAVIRKAYLKASIALHETDYVECHGTGTKVGDPIEVEALSRVFSSERKNPLLLGSVKTNVGHSEAASGIASIIKATIMLEAAAIPPTHGLRNINPRIKADEWNVRVVTQNEPWPGASLGKPRRISVNSFGYGGANAHAVLENVDSFLPDLNGSLDPNSNENWTYILPFSSKTQAGLRKRVASLVQRSYSSHDLIDLAYTLGCRRSFFSARGFLLARQCSLKEDLQELNLVPGQGQISPTPLPILMIFTGQGAQWPQMGLTLFQKHASFRASIQSLDAHLRCIQETPTWTIEQTLGAVAAESHVSHPWRSQSVCTAVQIALVDLFRQWGVNPQLVVGHSSGEIAAAYAAGHITSYEAIMIAYYRGFVVAHSKIRGAMMAIGMSEKDAKATIDSADLGGSVRVACKNSPQSSTLSGNEEAIDILLELLISRRIFARKLHTSGIAYHSYDMVNLGSTYQNLLSTHLRTREASKDLTSTPRMISSITGEYVDVTQTSHSLYWRTNLESPVEFAKAIGTAFKGGAYHFLELGPHSALELPLKQIHANQRVDSPFLYSSAIVRGVDSIKSSLNAVGNLFVSGHDIRFGKVNSVPHKDGTIPEDPTGKVLTDLPGYPWQHQTILWNESRMSTEYRFRKHSRHDLLGSIVPGGSTRNVVWRNLLRLREVRWLADHRLEESTVFPAAGYMAMAVEALSRTSPLPPASSMVFFRSVHFLKALVIPSDGHAMTELVTEVCACKLSQTTDSKVWHQFEISSVSNGRSTRHATGLMSIEIGEAEATGLSTSNFDLDLESLDPKQWYEQFATLGLRYGPYFQSIHDIHIHRSRSERVAKSEIQTSRVEVRGSHKESRCVLYPAIIDALLQTGLIADSSGDLAQLRAGLPVSIEAFALTAFDPKALMQSLVVRATASQVGSGTISFDLELRNAENSFIGSMQGVRMTEYLSVRPDTQSARQSPIFDLVWKPDVDRLQPCSYQAFVREVTLSGADPTQHSLRQVTGILDLVQHKKLVCRVLDIDAPCSGQDILGDTVRVNSGHGVLHHHGQTYVRGRLGVDGIITLTHYHAEGHDQTPRQLSDQDRFDVIMWLAKAQPQPWSFLADNALVLCLKNDCEAQLIASSFTVISTYEGHILPLTVARINKPTPSPNITFSERIVLVMPDEPSAMCAAIAQGFADSIACSVMMFKLANISLETLPSGAIVVALVELEEPVLSSLTREKMHAIKMMNMRARKVLWTTGGGLIRAAKPEMSIALGFFRTMRLEYYPTKFGILDVEYPGTDADLIVSSVVNVLSALETQLRGDDEFILHNGLLHISRSKQLPSLNSLLTSKQDKKTSEVPRGDLDTARLAIRQPGNISTTYLQQYQGDRSPVRDDEVEIDVLAVGLNAKDFYTLMGRVDTRESTSSLECTGTVRAVGAGVSNLSQGDRVVVMAPRKFATVIRVPVSCCCKLFVGESNLEMATVPIVFSSAIYALQYRARLQPLESVLIHSATGGLGQAAIQVARSMNADIFATAGTEDKRKYLHEVLGVARNHIFSSRDATFLADVMRETAGRGIDVVLNSLSGDLLHAGWRCMAEFGRFIEMGKKDVTEAGNLDMSVFGRGASFSAFDLTDLYYSKNPAQSRIWAELLRESLRLVRRHTCQPIKPLQSFGLSEIQQALRFFAAHDRLGKVVVDVAGENLALPIMTDRYNTLFSSSKTYLMVGCLGGIGRCLSRWMMSRGARNFLFLGRSGTDKLPAKLMVEELLRAGGNVKVAKADVCNAAAVAGALKEADTTIGGVIQAAMSLKESLFSNMDVSDWHLALESKVKGTWNLHHCLRSHDSELDFFVMTSSITGSVGQATQSNYSAANGFLDAFARHRHMLGLPGTSIALGAVKGVGYLAEHPEAGTMLERQGFPAMNEEELLQLIDIGISGSQTETGKAKTTSRHPNILTGLNWQNPVPRIVEDARFGIMASHLSESSLGRNTATVSDKYRLPKPVEDALSVDDKNVLHAAIESEVAGKLAMLVQSPAELISSQTSLADIGMDSMMAVEARREVTLGVDVPLIDFMTTKATVGDIGRKVVEGLEQRSTK